jgi:hypothetical protein
MALWTFLAADLKTNIVLGEIPVSGVRMSKTLNGAGQAQAQFDLGDPRVQALDVFNMTRPARRVFYALRGGRPWWGGIIWGSAYDSETARGTISCADFWSYFDHRKILEAFTLPLSGAFDIAGQSRIYTAQDQNAIARDLVTLAQTHTGGNIGIVVDTGVLSGTLRDRTYEGFDLKDVGAALRDLANLADGCDMLFDVGPLDSNGRPARIMRTGTPFLTQAGADWTWDLGGNMLSYQWDAAGGAMATRMFAQGAGTERGSQIAVAQDDARIADGWPLLESDRIFNTTSDITALQSDADGLLSSTSLPTVSLTMRLDTSLPPQLDFSVGDFGVANIPAGDLFHKAGMSLPVRIIGATVNLDAQGQENVEVTCQSLQEVT